MVAAPPGVLISATHLLPGGIIALIVIGAAIILIGMPCAYIIYQRRKNSANYKPVEDGSKPF